MDTNSKFNKFITECGKLQGNDSKRLITEIRKFGTHYESKDWMLTRENKAAFMRQK